MAVVAGLALLAALVGLVVVGLRYQAEAREVKRVRTMFSRYLAPPIVDELLLRKDPSLYSGRSLQATIVVCRIWNFAGFAETLSAAETLRYLNEFFALAGTSIQKYRGMIDKFLGDGIIGVFGVPLEDPAAQEHALRAALDIVRLVDAMDQRWRSQGRRSFQVGIGISSGEVIAGDAGFNERREFTVVGPQTLFAERLAAATFDLNASIVAAAATCAPVRELFSLLPLIGHPLPGLKRLADAFIVLGLMREDSLLMPAESAFSETQIDANVRDAVPLPPRLNRISPAPPEPPALPRIELADPTAPLKPRKWNGETPDTAFRLPDLGAGDAPPGKRSAEYEDGDGPPVRLPP